MRFSLLSLAAAASLAAADSNTCSDDVTIKDLQKTFDCEVVEGKVTVDPSLSGDLIIDGAKQFKSDFIVSNVTNLLSIQSNSLNSIGGEFLLEDVNLLSSLQLPSLKSVDKLTLRRLKIISELTFGGNAGVSTASDVNINDCMSLSDLTGLQLTTVDNMQINNNPALVKFDSALVTINQTFIMTGNGQNMEVKFPDLESAFSMEISDVGSFEVPSLESIGSALRFENNSMIESFEAKNLTQVGKNEKDGGSLSFLNNKVLSNISFPVLEKINGDLTVLNNTNMTDFTGFPKLTSVYGALLLGGDFDEIDLPKVKTFGGAVNVQALNGTQDKICGFLENASVAGKQNCKPATKNANKDPNDPNSGSDDDGSDNSNGDSGAATHQLSAAAIGLTVIAAVAQLL